MRVNVRSIIFIISILGVMILGGWVGKIYFRTQWHDNHLNTVAQNQDKDKGFPAIGGPFQLIDQNGQARTNADFKGKIMLVYFGYTFCPDICPAALINITDAFTELGEKAQQIQPIFITIDPERDTVSHLKIYMENYHPSFLALTGDAHHIDAAKKAYRVYGAKAEPDDTSTEYIMDHTSIIYVMDRQGRFITHLNHLTPPKEIVRILKQIIN